jgi:tetratricopeptide (TPR) repeat protein
MMHVMGNVYGSLGSFSKAGALLAAAEIRHRLLGAGNPDTLQSMHHLADVLDQESRYAEAEKCARQTLDTRRRVLGAAHRDTLSSMSELARILNDQGRYREAEKLNREALDAAMRVLAGCGKRAFRCPERLNSPSGRT